MRLPHFDIVQSSEVYLLSMPAYRGPVIINKEGNTTGWERLIQESSERSPSLSKTVLIQSNKEDGKNREHVLHQVTFK